MPLVFERRVIEQAAISFCSSFRCVRVVSSVGSLYGQLIELYLVYAVKRCGMLGCTLNVIAVGHISLIPAVKAERCSFLFLSRYVGKDSFH